MDCDFLYNILKEMNSFDNDFHNSKIDYDMFCKTFIEMKECKISKECDDVYSMLEYNIDNYTPSDLRLYFEHGQEQIDQCLKYRKFKFGNRRKKFSYLK